MKDVNISIQNISKVEGHADLEIKIKNGNVENVYLKFTENKRFFTQAIRKKAMAAIPQSVARICGTCSIAHIMASIEALEKSLDVTPSDQTMLLKKLTMYGLMIRDHALHIYLFSLPDVFNVDSVLDFDEKQSKYLHDAFAVKKAGNILSTVVAGRAVHAPYPVVGGFLHTPTDAELKQVAQEMRGVRQKVIDVMDVYFDCETEYPRDTDFVALVNEPFDFLEGKIMDSKGNIVKERDYLSHLQKKVMPYSQSIGYQFEGSTYMVGALARLNLNKQNLHKDTRESAKKHLAIFPSTNIFHNNLAQGIEILHSIDHSLEIIESNSFKEEKPPLVKPKMCEGVGVIEAPRGTLYYHLDMDAQGIIQEGTIVVPTQQNQINMELDIKHLVQRKLNVLTKPQIEYEIEKLIRAYDPCISCASHFLKVNWS